MKKCSKCREIKELKLFSKNRSRKDGLRHSCKECDKLHYRHSPTKRVKYSKTYYEKNKEKIAKKDRLYREANKEKINKRNLAYQYRKYKEDPRYRALRNARLRISNFLKNKEKFSKSLGCSYSQFILHIESQFQLGMSWQNYGEWHIDHKHPLSKAYNEGQESFMKSCNYTNLQPMWALDNLRKADKVQAVNLNRSINSLEAQV